jgi:hypothetical protein
VGKPQTWTDPLLNSKHQQPTFLIRIWFRYVCMCPFASSEKTLQSQIRWTRIPKLILCPSLRKIGSRSKNQALLDLMRTFRWFETVKL